MANASLEITLPATLKAYVEERVAEQSSTLSEYVSPLIRADQERRAQEQLDQRLLEGLRSTPEEATEHLAELRREVEEVIAKRRAARP